jgi:hypothetical protein
MGGHPDFLAGLETFRIAGLPLARRHFVTENNLRMRHFNPAEHVIHAFDKNPALYSRFVSWWISNLAAKSPIDGKSRKASQQRKSEAEHPAPRHTNCDAKLPGGGGLLSRNTQVQDE